MYIILVILLLVSPRDIFVQANPCILQLLNVCGLICCGTVMVVSYLKFL